MCGIVGFSGKQKAAPIIFEGLKRVEYRGYDSAGIAMVCDGQLCVTKEIGKLDTIEQKCQLTSINGSIGIGHTRWATHGGVTPENAHPHMDCTKAIAVVHNGTIDNFQELRRMLIEHGHTFLSETDTEVIPHLIEEEMGKGLSLREAVALALSKIEGSFAVLLISSKEPDTIIGIRKDNPLIIGISDRGIFAGSDALSFPSYVKLQVQLDDGEIAVIKSGTPEFYDMDGNKLQKESQKLDSAWAGTEKQGYKYYMLKEILEQPEILESSTQQNRELFTSIAMDILRAEQVIFTASGTSRYASLVGRYMISKVGRKLCEIMMGSEFHYFIDSADKNSVIIAVSQSGETADVIEGVKRARSVGARIVSVVNRPLSLLADLSQRVILLNCGPEVGVAATKSFLGQLVVFYLLAYAMTNDFDKAVETIKGLRTDVFNTIYWNNEKLRTLSQNLCTKKDFYYIARGINFAIASEGALKLKEISYIHAEGMPAGELKHGTLALIEPGTPVIVICPNDYTYKETLSNAIEAKARGAFIIAVSDIDNEIYDYWIKIPSVDELLYPLVTIIPLQLMAYYIAISLGLDPDMPRNLAKSVTVK